MKLLTWLLIVATLVALIWYAPKYLAYSDQPVKSDVIILFAGTDWNARKKEALKLMEEGYAHHLLIPAFGQAFDLHSLSRIHASTHPRVSAVSNYPNHFEDTHIEILEAKKMMDKAGFRSAIFVSSPFHMRRISIIGAKVFERIDFSIKFVPTRYEKKTDGFWLFSKQGNENIASEYVKTAWFLVYKMFS